MRKMDCLRCNTPMRYIKTDKIQLGQTGWFLGDLPNLIAGALDVEFYSCPSCGKIELFQSDTVQQRQELPQRKCPNCGKTHDFDYPKCPSCKFTY